MCLTTSNQLSLADHHRDSGFSKERRTKKVAATVAVFISSVTGYLSSMSSSNHSKSSRGANQDIITATPGTAGHGGGRAPNVRWTDEEIHAMLDYFIENGFGKETDASMWKGSVVQGAVDMLNTQFTPQGAPKSVKALKEKWGRLKKIWSRVNDYSKKSGCHWDDENGANIQGHDAEIVWNELVSQTEWSDLRPFRNNGWTFASAMRRLAPSGATGKNRFVSGTSGSIRTTEMNDSSAEMSSGGAGVSSAMDVDLNATFPAAAPAVAADPTSASPVCQPVLSTSSLPPLSSTSIMSPSMSRPTVSDSTTSLISTVSSTSSRTSSMRRATATSLRVQPYPRRSSSSASGNQTVVVADNSELVEGMKFMTAALKEMNAPPPGPSEEVMQACMQKLEEAQPPLSVNEVIAVLEIIRREPSAATMLKLFNNEKVGIWVRQLLHGRDAAA